MDIGDRCKFADSPLNHYIYGDGYIYSGWSDQERGYLLYPRIPL